ncbi:MAG: single-stranded-DNA-specific exonuclease RecJ [Rhodobacteraceae bacterium]|nr:single-stranded-DNA-specific exonuclease RecJ [Paracoccaceae bacterium]
MTRPAFLGIEKSVRGHRWVGADAAQDRLALAMAQRTDLPDALCRILVRQGVAPERVSDFLEPTMKNLMPDPSAVLDMDRAVARFIQALDRKERIAVFADYDVDGGSSAAQLICWLRWFGRETTLYVPHRIKEGFGPNPDAMAALAETHDLIICVDCGTSAHVAIESVAGTDVIVIDHHAGEATLPPAYAVVNPNRRDDESEVKYLCAAGVVFMFLVAANRSLRAAGQEQLPDLQEYLDLVALATVADVSPLVSLNRALVRRGLAVIEQRRRPGLRALADVGRIRSKPHSHHLGFVLGPRINAGGRLGHSELGARLLATDDHAEAEKLALELDSLNSSRRQLVDQTWEEAREQVEARGSEGALIWAASKGWSAGVAGIVASRLCETTNRPVMIFAIGEDSCKGSARSIEGVDIGAAIQSCKEEGLLLSGGGHKMAGGLEIRNCRFNAAIARLTELMQASGADKAGPPVLRVDASIYPRAITPELVEMLEHAGPFGAASPQPRFVLPGHRVVFHRRVGGDGSHLMFQLEDEAGEKMDAIAFQAFKTPLGDFIENLGSARAHFAGQLQADEFRGKVKVKLHLQDAAPARTQIDSP